MRRPDIRLLALPVLVTLAVLLAPGRSSSAYAQAWVNPKGELSLTLRSDYQTSSSVYHERLICCVPVQSFNDALTVEYVPLEHLALGATLNGNGIRYSGDQVDAISGIKLAHGSHDDGSFHWSVTDLEVDARYQVFEGAVTLTPVLHVRTPLTSYEENGYAASGSHLTEGGVGLYLGRYGLGLEDLVLQAGYTFTYVSTYSPPMAGNIIPNYRPNRSDAELILSYVINDKLIVSAGAAFRYTHDGYDLANYNALLQSDPMMNDPLFTKHDPILKVAYLAPAAIVSYQLTPAWSLAGRVADVVWGQSTTNPLSFGVTLGWANNLAN
jgi:hypothetical protein